MSTIPKEGFLEMSKVIFNSIDHYREAGRDDQFNIQSIAEYLERQLATDWREELEKENSQLKISLEMAQLGWAETSTKKDDWMHQAKALSAIKKGLEKSYQESLDQITALQSQCTEKEKECEERGKLILEMAADRRELASKYNDNIDKLEELKAENERLKGKELPPHLEKIWQDFLTENNL